MPEKIEEEREFHSLQEFQEVVFPNSLREKQKEKDQESFEEYGKTLACNFIDNLKNKI